MMPITLHLTFQINHIDQSACGERHGNPVDAIAQMRGGRPVFKDVAQMAAACRAVDLGTGHPKAAINCRFGCSWHGIVKAGPASAAFEFCFGFKEFLPATRAGKAACMLFRQKRAATGTFGTVSAHHAKLFRGQHLTPFRIGPGNRK